MITDSLELQQNGAHDQRPRRDFNLSHSFDGLTESRAMRKTGISRYTLGEKNSFVNRQPLEELFGAFMRVEHSKLQVEYRFPSNRETEMAGLDGTRMDRSHGNLKDTFSQSGPVDVAFSFKRRQYRVYRKILAQGVDIGPIVVQRHPTGIRVADGSQSKPVLDFAFLPVRCGQFGRERWKPGIVGGYGCPHDQVLRVILLFENVVVKKDALRGTSVLGEHSNQSSFELPSQVFHNRPNVWIADK